MEVHHYSFMVYVDQSKGYFVFFHQAVASHLRLAIHLILRSEFNAAIGVLAVVCSSWVPVNRASTGRDLMTPLGNENFVAVRKSNKLTSRKGACDPVKVCGGQGLAENI